MSSILCANCRSNERLFALRDLRRGETQPSDKYGSLVLSSHHQEILTRYCKKWFLSRGGAARSIVPKMAALPSTRPLMFKALFVDYLFGIRSERRLVQEIAVNVAYRWFLRLKLTDAVFDGSTLS